MTDVELVQSELDRLVETFETTAITRIDSYFSICFGGDVYEYDVTAYRVGKKLIRVDLKAK